MDEQEQFDGIQGLDTSVANWTWEMMLHNESIMIASGEISPDMDVDLFGAAPAETYQTESVDLDLFNRGNPIEDASQSELLGYAATPAFQEYPNPLNSGNLIEDVYQSGLPVYSATTVSQQYPNPLNNGSPVEDASHLGFPGYAVAASYQQYSNPLDSVNSLQYFSQPPQYATPTVLQQYPSPPSSGNTFEYASQSPEYATPTVLQQYPSPLSSGNTFDYASQSPEHAAGANPSLMQGNFLQGTFSQDSLSYGMLPASTLPARTLPVHTLPVHTLPVPALPAQTLPQRTCPPNTTSKGTTPPQTPPEPAVAHGSLPGKRGRPRNARLHDPEPEATESPIVHDAWKAAESAHGRLQHAKKRCDKFKADAEENETLLEGDKVCHELSRKEKFVEKNTILYTQAVHKYWQTREAVKSGRYEANLPGTRKAEEDLANLQRSYADRRNKYQVMNNGGPFNKAQKMWLSSAENKIKEQQNEVDVCRQRDKNLEAWTEQSML